MSKVCSAFRATVLDPKRTSWGAVRLCLDASHMSRLSDQDSRSLLTWLSTRLPGVPSWIEKNGPLGAVIECLS